MKNRILTSLMILTFGALYSNAQSVAATFDESAIGAEGTSELTLVIGAPITDLAPGDLQVIIDFPDGGQYIDITDAAGPIAVAGSPVMTWTKSTEANGSDSWTGVNVNTVTGVIGGGTWMFEVEGVGPDTGGAQEFTNAEGYFNGDLVADQAGLVIDALLPVSLTKFEITRSDCQSVLLEWATASEINNVGFAIERSVGSADNFQQIGFKSGLTSSTTNQDYTFADNIESLRANGVIYYRLIQKDIDGRSSNSDIISVTVECGESERLVISSYPNPTINELYVNFESGAKSATKVVILNSTSQLVQSAKRTTEEQLIMDVSNLTAGIYYVQVVDNDNAILYNEKIIKVGN